MKKQFLTVDQLVIIGLLTGVCVVMDLTQIGLIATPTMNFTFLHVPVLIGAILQGPLVGSIVGLMFGIISLIKQFTKPTLMSPILMDPLISVGVRVLMGLLAGYIYNILKKKNINKTISIGISAFLGSMTNTVGVLGLAWLLHLESFAKVKNLPVEKVKGFIASIAVFNGIPEAIIAVAISIPVCLALFRNNFGSKLRLKSE